MVLVFSISKEKSNRSCIISKGHQLATKRMYKWYNIIFWPSCYAITSRKIMILCFSASSILFYHPKDVKQQSISSGIYLDCLEYNGCAHLSPTDQICSPGHLHQPSSSHKASKKDYKTHTKATQTPQKLASHLYYEIASCLHKNCCCLYSFCYFGTTFVDSPCQDVFPEQKISSYSTNV